MSRSKYQNRTSDPAQIIMQWRAEEGLFKTTNLITKESGELPPPISFIVLDELQAVKDGAQSTIVEYIQTCGKALSLDTLK